MISEPDNEMRTCNKCHHEKPITEFYRQSNPNDPDRMDTMCKECRRKYNREYDRKRTAELKLLRARNETGFLGLTVTITQRKKERLAFDLDCGVHEIDELLRSGVLDTPGVTFRNGEK